MAKFLVCIALLCVALAAVHGAPRGGPRGGSQDGSGKRGSQGSRPGRGHGHDDGNQWESTLCQNTSNAQAYLSQTRTALNDLKNNGSFTNFLAKRQNEFNYINNDANTGLITSNCTQFFTGVDAARALDKQAAQQEWQYSQTANQILRNIVKALAGSSSVDTNSSEGV